MNNNNFEFGNTEKNSEFAFGTISGLGQSNYENEDLFNTEVDSPNNDVAISDTFETNDNNENAFNTFETTDNNENAFNTFETNVVNDNSIYNNVEIPVGYGMPNLYSTNDENQSIQIDSTENLNEEYSNEVQEEILDNNELNEENNTQAFEPAFNDVFYSQQPSQENFALENENVLENAIDYNNQDEVSEELNNILDESSEEIVEKNDVIDTEFLDKEETFENFSLGENYNLPVVEPTVQAEPEYDATKQNILSETPIEELNKLTEYSEEKFEPTDIKALFDRVGVNVKEASDIFKKNTEMKEKIDSRFEELKKLQSEVEKAKKSQYDEINSYKEEVLGKLTEKKEEIEKRINKLKDFQSSLEKEKEEFEAYRKKEKEEIEKVQKEVQDAYESRREELNHIEDVLRKQKDSLDEERSQLSLDRIQYESDKNELANNLLKFNEIVDSFTNGMNKLEKESE